MRINEIIGDRYKIIEPLGEGGMANVYRAHDLILGRDVTIKMLRLDLRDNPTVRHRFENEIAATAELNHANIIQVYDYGEDEAMQYLVTEYIEGTDLKRYIAMRKPIPVTRVVDIYDGILAGVEEAHAHDIIHRDLKPQNVLIDVQGNPEITDFGIATGQSEAGMTATNTAIGSVHYMSPEQVKGEGATNRSDIYALGVMLYEMLTGVVPFDADDAVAIAVKHARAPIPYVRDFDPRIPQALENVILRAMQKNPMDRYANVTEMRRDLSTVLAPERINETRFGVEKIKTIVDNSATRVLPITDQNDSVAPEVAKQRQTYLVAVTGKETNGRKAAGLREDYINVLMPDTKERQRFILKQDLWSTVKKAKEAKITVEDGVVVAFEMVKPAKSKWRFLVYAIGLLVTLAVVLAAMNYIIPDKVTIAELNGKSLAQVKTTLKENDLKVGNVKYVYSKKVDKGKVITTNPKKGAQVNEGTAVNIEVSKGAKHVRFGEYENEKYSLVAATLRAKGYTVQQEKVNSDLVPVGYIVSQDIDAEKKVVPSDTTVTFKVSKGEKQITVPDFSDMTKAEAQAKADALDLTVYFNEITSDSVDYGKVINQSVVPGQKISQSETVNINISDSVATKNFVGSTYKSVLAWAKKYGITVQQTSDLDSLQPKGTVTDQSPTAGERVSKGGTITVSVSTGTKTSSSSSSSSSSSAESSTSSN